MTKSPEPAIPALLHVPLGTGQTGTRQEFDSMGSIAVPAEHYWGAQTQRSLTHFAIGQERMPLAVYHAYGYVKKAAAIVNAADGRLPPWKATAILHAADEIIGGNLDSEFPLYVWQTGSGTQSNMNVNEVISNRANQLLGGTLGSQQPIHPNDDVNMAQSSNDTFPTAMHIAAARELRDRFFPSLGALQQALADQAEAFADIVKIGRTHLQDAVPLTVGQEWSGYAVQLADALTRVRAAQGAIAELALGGTAVGTGLNAPPHFGAATAKILADLTGLPLVTARNKFAAQASLDALVALHGTLRGVAVALMKIADDIRWLGSGPRCGLHELILPDNEPGSSIMPGKVNPTQAEALMMVCVQVLGLDSAVGFAGSLGNLELNTFRPLVIHNVLQSIRLLADMCQAFRVHCVVGIQVDKARVAQMVGDSLMLVTALSPVLGYDQAAAIAHEALAHNQTLRQAAIASGKITAAEFDRVVDPQKMVGN